MGALTPISGVVNNLQGPATGYKAVLYVLDAGGSQYWIKPGPGSSVPLAADGSFSFTNWASNPSSEGAPKNMRSTKINTDCVAADTGIRGAAIYIVDNPAAVQTGGASVVVLRAPVPPQLL